MHVKDPLRTIWRILFLKAPVEAQLIVTRRCNLSCGYCSEYDDFSAPVPLDELKRRIDALHRLRVVNIALLGGEPLLHPNIDEIVAYGNRKSQVSITSNGFLISDTMIERLNDAGLSNLQISIDTLNPDSTLYIQKSLKPLLPKLKRLKRLANFDVHITNVLCENSRDQFRDTVKEIQKLGFSMTANLIHNDRGMVEINGSDYLELWEHHFEYGNPASKIEYDYGKQLLQGQSPQWKCRAGARFLYVDEFGKAQYCSAQRGRLNIPITEYTREDIREQSRTYKGCEQGCSLFCVYRGSMIDNSLLQSMKSAFYIMRNGKLSRGNNNAVTRSTKAGELVDTASG